MEIGCHLPTQGPWATPEALITFASKAEAHQQTFGATTSPTHWKPSISWRRSFGLP